MGTIIVSSVLVIAVGAVIFTMIKNKKKGKSSCGCGCSGCSGCTANSKCSGEKNL